ncbi:trypsin [Ferrimonas sediminicola]|uniref:Trypsin n=1 Tax=Ferrimonas sediminicola TaxID=2569538 RepID=A0A4U1BAX6_9GAMM|nr:VanZ family protein [Ferrimonas sediminicola]TKB47318.1 trypsin [Ferrimonas sediminicola]
MSRTLKVVAWAGTLALATLIAWVIYLADTGQSSVFFQLVRALPYGDKLGHFCLYGLLTLGANLVSGGRVWRCGSLRIYWGATAVGLLASLEELSQAWFPSRTLDITDLAADLAGILLFSLVTRYLLGVTRADPG